jgi:hypothetical protein
VQIILQFIDEIIITWEFFSEDGWEFFFPELIFKTVPAVRYSWSYLQLSLQYIFSWKIKVHLLILIYIFVVELLKISLLLKNKNKVLFISYLKSTFFIFTTLTGLVVVLINFDEEVKRKINLNFLSPQFWIPVVNRSCLEKKLSSTEKFQ